VPDIAGLEFVEEDTLTSFNEYHPTINSFGSRNLFELSGLEEKIVVLLGDSFFFGYGLNDDETVSYFLNKFDNNKKYINLALPGANIKDSVAIYFSKWENMRTPSAIILQLLWPNDICASSYIEEKTIKTVEKEYKYILPPFRYLFSKDKLYRFYLNRIYAKIYQDLSKERFDKYVRNPINELIEKTYASETKIIIITYGNKRRFENYTGWLKHFCVENNIYFYRIEHIIDAKYINDRLPDGHPSGKFNKVLAEQLVSLLKDSEI
jgi:hypothetical protein